MWLEKRYQGQHYLLKKLWRLVESRDGHIGAPQSGMWTASRVKDKVIAHRDIMYSIERVAWLMRHRNGQDFHPRTSLDVDSGHLGVRG